ncbi:coiled-coil domain-containing protein 91-like [Centruroides sculpturatus]|uniref:coiled-coil domain-containing protein 91-like n=1 Tax=Centruroides sculpturatus TaxID=218467 RepID=UPI000C6CAA16|nr:coiled-coil domain-containing protein 91-like [Centruroides sculpturatus]
MVYTIAERVEIVTLHFRNGENAHLTANLFNQRYPNKHCNAKYILELVQKFKLTGSVANKKRTPGRELPELLTERKNAVTENSKSVENLLNNLKQKDIYIQDLQSKLEELEKCLKKEENIKEKDLIQSKVDITELMNKKEELASDNEKLKLEHSKIKEKLDAVLRQKDNEIERLNELCEKLQHKTEELEFEIDEKMGELHECEKERDSLKEQFSLQKEKAIDIVNYEKEIELVKEQFENIKLELENTKLANNTLQNAITEKDNLLEIVNKRHIELQNEYIKSQHSLTEKDKLFCELKTKLEEMTSDFSKIKKIKQFESDELGSSTLQKLDQLHKEELSDLRATTRANQSNLENYVAKLKKQHITQKQSDSKDSSTNTSENEGKKV